MSFQNPLGMPKPETPYTQCIFCSGNTANGKPKCDDCGACIPQGTGRKLVICEDPALPDVNNLTVTSRAKARYRGAAHDDNNSFVPFGVIGYPIDSWKNKKREIAAEVKGLGHIVMLTVGEEGPPMVSWARMENPRDFKTVSLASLEQEAMKIVKDEEDKNTDKVEKDGAMDKVEKGSLNKAQNEKEVMIVELLLAIIFLLLLILVLKR